MWFFAALIVLPAYVWPVAVVAAAIVRKSH